MKAPPLPGVMICCLARSSACLHARSPGRRGSGSPAASWVGPFGGKWEGAGFEDPGRSGSLQRSGMVRQQGMTVSMARLRLSEDLAVTGDTGSRGGERLPRSERSVDRDVAVIGVSWKPEPVRNRADHVLGSAGNPAQTSDWAAAGSATRFPGRTRLKQIYRRHRLLVPTHRSPMQAAPRRSHQGRSPCRCKHAANLDRLVTHPLPLPHLLVAQACVVDRAWFDRAGDQGRRLPQSSSIGTIAARA